MSIRPNLIISSFYVNLQCSLRPYRKIGILRNEIRQ
jgi:hypothetical protein